MAIDKSKRTRNWACVVYPDSTVDDWIKILEEFHVPFLVSPLHDNDVSADGQPKKPHYHLLLCFDSVKTSDQAQEIFNSVNGVGIEKVSSLRGYARYLCHLDDPDKAQYNPNDVYAFREDYATLISLPTDKYDSIAAMIDFVDREQIISYAALLRYAKSYNEIWFRVLCDSGTLVMKEFIKSRTWELSNDVFAEKN